jgi:hypothetical protein
MSSLQWSDGGSSKRSRPGESGAGGAERTSSSSDMHVTPEVRISILEQRLHEIQALNFDSIFGDKQESTAPTKLYVDPLLNLEIGVLRQKEELLWRKLNSSELSSENTDQLFEMNKLKEENAKLKRKVESLSSENHIKQIEFKDNIIKELVNKLNDAKSWVKELEQDNACLSSQLLFYQQHIASLSGGQVSTEATPDGQGQ